MKPLISELLKSNDNQRIILELDEWVEELSEHGKDLERLTEHQKNFYLAQNLEKEINNGGFDQFFFNPTGDNAAETLSALKEIGAQLTANILERAIQQFPNGLAPKDRTARVEAMTRIEGIASEVWDDLDQEFYSYREDLSLLSVNYVKKHQHEF